MIIHISSNTWFYPAPYHPHGCLSSMTTWNLPLDQLYVQPLLLKPSNLQHDIQTNWTITMQYNQSHLHLPPGSKQGWRYDNKLFIWFSRRIMAKGHYLLGRAEKVGIEGDQKWVDFEQVYFNKYLSSSVNGLNISTLDLKRAFQW